MAALRGAVRTMDEDSGGWVSGEGRAMAMRVVVQHTDQLIRDGLGLVLAREPDLDVVGDPATPDELVATVENHKQRIFRKLDVQNQAHAVSVAIRRGLLSPKALAGRA